MNLKQILLATGYIIDNSYLDDYISLIETNRDAYNFSGYAENHHAIPVAIYKQKYNCTVTTARLLANNDLENFTIRLLFKDHCTAHWLLYKCVSGIIKAGMAKALVYMINKLNGTTVKIGKQTLEYGLSESEYDEVQLIKQRLINDQASEFWTDNENNWLRSHSYLTATECTKYLTRSVSSIQAHRDVL